MKEIRTTKSDTRSKYIKQINDLLGKIKKAVNSKSIESKNTQIDLQVAIDTIADTYQDDESIGTVKYKMYYVQALLMHYSSDNKSALDYLESAELAYGGNFKEGDLLRSIINSRDSEEDADSLVEPNDEMAIAPQPVSAWLRFFNLTIDIATYYLVLFLLALFVGYMTASTTIFTDEATGGANGASYIFSYSVLFLYYFVMESVWGRTMGKILTGTKVVTKDGGKPGVGVIFVRTICRLIPFEAFSYLSTNPVGWHDSLSSTIVARNKKARQ